MFTNKSENDVPCNVKERSFDDMLPDEHSRSRSFDVWFVFFRFFRRGVSPQRFEPPQMLGMLRRAIPSNEGPLEKSNATPSHQECKTKPREMIEKNWISLYTKNASLYCIQANETDYLHIHILNLKQGCQDVHFYSAFQNISKCATLSSSMQHNAIVLTTAQTINVTCHSHSK